MTTISALLATHWPEVSRIYGEGIATGQATFETEVPTWTQWDATHLRRTDSSPSAPGRSSAGPLLRRSRIAASTRASSRTFYVSAAARGRGVGRLLLDALVTSTEQEGIWTIQTGVFPENEASVRLHERAGFTVVGRRRWLGRLNGVWRDVLLLERRSAVVG